MPAPACKTLYSPLYVLLSRGASAPVCQLSSAASRLPLAAVEDGEDAVATCLNLELTVCEVAGDERAIADCLDPALAACADEGGEDAVDDRCDPELAFAAAGEAEVVIADRCALELAAEVEEGEGAIAAPCAMSTYHWMMASPWHGCPR